MLVLTCTLGLAAACTQAQDGVVSPLTLDISEAVVEIDYQPDAEPYTNALSNGESPFVMLRTNIDALFAGSGVDVQVPERLADMQELPAVTASTFDADDILDLANLYRDFPPSGERASFYVLFLDGVFREKEEVKGSVLGVSIGDTGVIALFKPVIEAAGLPLVRLFVEQSTLVHEIGHAVGLVNNGLAMVSPHHDAANGEHCTNRDCVMYHANEGLADLISFRDRFNGSFGITLFGQECLDDAQAALAR